LASYNPFTRCIAPGPEVARHTPSFPVYFAYAQTINAADSLCEYEPNLVLPGSCFYNSVIRT